MSLDLFATTHTQQALYPRQVLLTLLACAVTTGLSLPLLDYLDLANIVMLFLLTVLLVAVKIGRRAAVLASVASVLCFDVFFVPPRFSLAVSNVQYVVTFAVMLITALTTTHFTAQLQQRAREALQREERTRALYKFAKQLAGVVNTEQLAQSMACFIERQHLEQFIIVPAPTNVGQQPEWFIPSTSRNMCLEPHLAQMAFYTRKTIQAPQMGATGYASLYLPLLGSEKIYGVLATAHPPHEKSLNGESTSLLETVASLIAVTLERLHYAEVAHSIKLNIESERLRSSILSALSHDLRTPLTALVGLTDSLFLHTPPLPNTALDTAQTLHEQATRLTHLVSNLLDMAKLNAGDIRLRREWQPLEEVIGSSLKLLGVALSQHTVKVQLENDLPLLEFDAVLIERVLCNLLENAAKYSPPHTTIVLSAHRQGPDIHIAIADEGIGFPEQNKDDLFDMFTRAPTENHLPGTGLGLSICKAIVHAHHGSIHADNRHPQKGGIVQFTLPVGEPPSIEDEPA